MPAPTMYVYTALELLTAAKMNDDGDNTQLALDAVWEPSVLCLILNTQTALTAGDNLLQFHIPPKMNGWTITRVTASRASGTGKLTIQLHNVTDAVDVLSTRLTIDTGETSSSTAAAAAVINAANDDVASYDRFRIDIDDAGTNTLHATMNIEFTRP